MKTLEQYIKEDILSDNAISEGVLSDIEDTISDADKCQKFKVFVNWLDHLLFKN